MGTMSAIEEVSDYGDSLLEILIPCTAYIERCEFPGARPRANGAASREQHRQSFQGFEPLDGSSDRRSKAAE